MRHVADGLDDLLELQIPHFIQQQSKQNDRGEADQQRLQTEDQCIPGVLQEVGGLEEDHEVIKAYKGAALQTQPGVVVKERQGKTPHGVIVEQEIVNKSRNEQRKQELSLPKALGHALLFLPVYNNGCLCRFSFRFHM